jgi:hypothetical protein
MPRSNDPLAGTELVIKTIVDHYLHQDTLIWARIPYLILINAAVWSGAYSLSSSIPSHPLLAFFVCVMGILFTYLLLVIVLGAMKNRDINRALLQELLSDFIGTDTYAKMLKHVKTTEEAEKAKTLDGTVFMLAAPAKGVYRRGGIPMARARGLFEFALWTSIYADLILGLYVITKG